MARCCSQVPFGSSPQDRAGPNPDVVLVGWRSKPDLDGAFGPANCIGLDEFLDTVLPQDPGVHLRWDRRRGDAEIPHLLGLETTGLSLGEARTFGHHLSLSNKRSNNSRTGLFLGQHSAHSRAC